MRRIERSNAWISLHLGIRLEWQEEKALNLYRPDGRRFLTSVELEERAIAAEQRAEQAEQQAEHVKQQAQQREKQLCQKLRDLGLDPDQL